MSPLPEPVFRFCPECGSEGMARPENNAMGCLACGFQFFINSSGAVVALVEDDCGRLLLTRRGKDPGKGMWDLPGGFVDIGETAEDAVCREIREELNLDVVKSTYLGSLPGTYRYAGVTYYILNLVFSCRVNCFDGMRAADDVSEFMFVKKGEIDPGQIGLESIRSVLRATTAENRCFKLDKEELKW